MVKSWLDFILKLRQDACITFRSALVGGVKSGIDAETFDYDKHAAVYYSNLIKTLILFSLTRNDLEKLSSPTFDPIFELESELDHAFTPMLFDTIFRNKLVPTSFKQELLLFKQEADAIPDSIWDWEFLEIDSRWQSIRNKALYLLAKLDSAFI